VTTREGENSTVSRGRKVGIGCVTFFLGALSGGMIAVLISKLVAFLTRAPSCPGIPTCNWYIYWVIGALLGAVSLSALTVYALSKPKKIDNN
jgi:hypothetical protein